jgi:peptidoglycan/LPS O-acetylase OafA/YrhL
MAGVALSVVVASAYRCIDSPEFYYPPALAYAWGGAALLFLGGTQLAHHRRGVWVALVLLGVLLLAFALAGPSFKTCGPFEGLRTYSN